MTSCLQNFLGGALPPSIEARMGIIAGTTLAVASVVSVVAFAILFPPVAAIVGVALTGHSVAILSVVGSVAFLVAAVSAVILFCRRRGPEGPTVQAPPALRPAPDVKCAIRKNLVPECIIMSLRSTQSEIEPMAPVPEPVYDTVLRLPDQPSLPSPWDPMNVPMPLPAVRMPSREELTSLASTPSPELDPKDFKQSILVEDKSRSPSPLSSNSSPSTSPRLTDDIVDEFEVLPEESMDAPPGDNAPTMWGALCSAAAAAATVFSDVSTVKYSEATLRTHAMKFEALLGTLNNALKERFLEETPLPKRKEYDDAYLAALEQAYRATLDRVRQGVQEGRPAYSSVCYELYTKNSLAEANDSLFSLVGIHRPEGGPRLFAKLAAANEAANNVSAENMTNPVNRWWQSLRDKAGLFFSPISAGNPPQKMSELEVGDHKVEIVGMGSPTIQATNFSAEIDPLFVGYLKYLRSVGKKHFYISNQNTLNEENMRNSVIMELAEKFPETFFAMTQSKNTKFYHAKLLNAEGRVAAFDLKKGLHDNFFVRDILCSGSGLSRNLKGDKRLEQFSDSILKDVHKRLFNGREELNKEEAKLFIELYYNLLTLEITHAQQPNFMNFTCKDGIDRGMGSLAWFTMMIEMSFGRKEKTETESLLKTAFFTRAFWTRKRNILGERFFRTMEDMETLEKLDPDFGKMHALLSGRYGSLSVKPFV